MAFTQEQVDAHNARVLASRESYAQRVANRGGKTMAMNTAIAKHVAENPEANVLVAGIERNLNIKRAEPKKRELMNGTETIWHAELLRRYPMDGGWTVLCQAITIRLGDLLNYRPDFAIIAPPASGWPITFYETKAPHRFATAGLTKVKAAAALCPWARFVFVMRDRGQWLEREIGRE